MYHFSHQKRQIALLLVGELTPAEELPQPGASSDIMSQGAGEQSVVKINGRPIFQCMDTLCLLDPPMEDAQGLPEPCVSSPYFAKTLHFMQLFLLLL